MRFEAWEELKKQILYTKFASAALHGYTDPKAITDVVLECVGMTDQADKSCSAYRFVV